MSLKHFKVGSVMHKSTATSLGEGLTTSLYV